LHAISKLWKFLSVRQGLWYHLYFNGCLLLLSLPLSIGPLLPGALEQLLPVRTALHIAPKSYLGSIGGEEHDG
jgi:hypothetical protein